MRISILIGSQLRCLDKTIIGMGGVTVDNLSAFDTLGYNGVGVLGGIWKSDTPVAVFKKMKLHFK